MRPLLFCPLLLFANHYLNSELRDQRHKDLLNPKHQYLLGDMGGLRPALAKKGITLAADYLQYVLGNPVGQERGLVQTEHFTFDLNWDFTKISPHVEGLEFHLGAVLITGQNLESRTKNAFPLTLLLGQRTFIVNNVYFKQTAYDGNFAIKFGRIMSGDDFINSPSHHRFLSLAFNAQIALYINTPASGYPNAAWGAFTSLGLSKSVGLQMGVYLANESAYDNKHHGLDLSFDAPGGAELIAEIAYRINQEGRGLPGTFKQGVFYFTGTQGRYLSNKNTGNYGTYFCLDQDLWKDKKFTSFLTLLFFPEDRNEFPFYFTTGLISKGLIPKRPLDTTALGIARGSYSKDLRQLQQAAKNSGINGTYGNQPQNFEMLIEFNHWFNISPWLNITPAIQYVINPSGRGVKNALVLAPQSNVYF